MNDNTSGYDPSGEQIYLRKDRAASRAIWFYLGAVGLFGMALLGFLLAILTDAGVFRLQFTTTLPALAGIGMLVYASSLSGAPEMIRVGPMGLTIQGARSVKRTPWEEMGWARVEMQALSMKRQLIVYSTSGSTVAKVSDVFHDFDELADKVIAGIAERDEGTAEHLQKKKGRRSAILMGSVGGFMLLATLFLAYSGYDRQRFDRLFNEQAVDGEGIILERFIAPNGITKRLEYRVTGTDGRTATRNVELTPGYWDSLEGAETVPVRYVPDEPRISRPREGEVVEGDLTQNPSGMYVMSGFGGLMAVFFLVAAVLSWKGWQIDLDSKTGKVSIKRFGTGR